MDFQLIITSAVAVVAIGLYVVALWIGDHRTISMLAGVSNFTFSLAMIAISLARALGLQLSLGLLINPNNWVRAVGNLLEHI